MDPSNPETWWDKYGILGIAVFVFAMVIMYLFRVLSAAQQARLDQCELERKAREAEKEKWVLERGAWVLERGGWEIEREAMRAEYETKHRELSEKMARDVRDFYRDAQDREDSARREFSELMEKVSSNNATSSAAATAVMQKIYERIVEPRSRRGG